MAALAADQFSIATPVQTRKAGTLVRELLESNVWENIVWGDKKARLGHGPDSLFTPLLGQDGKEGAEGDGYTQILGEREETIERSEPPFRQPDFDAAAACA